MTLVCISCSRWFCGPAGSSLSLSDPAVPFHRCCRPVPLCSSCCFWSVVQLMARQCAAEGKRLELKAEPEEKTDFKWSSRVLPVVVSGTWFSSYCCGILLKCRVGCHWQTSLLPSGVLGAVAFHCKAQCEWSEVFVRLQAGLTLSICIKAAVWKTWQKATTVTWAGIWFVWATFILWPVQKCYWSA